MQTNTYDTLVILRNKKIKPVSRDFQKIIATFIKHKLGKQKQIYPPYSSKTVSGKSLFWWAKNKKLSEIKIPERVIEIYDFKLDEIKKISATKLKKEIMKQIDSV